MPRPAAPLSTGLGHGAMTAALVIVPADPACAWSASAPADGHPGRWSGPGVVPSGAPWMVRLSMARADLTSDARLVPARKHPLGSHRHAI